MTNRANQRTRKPAKTISMIVALLIGSAAVRLALGADAVLAVATESDSELTETDSELTCSQAETPAALLAALQSREVRIEQREAQFMDRMQALRVAEAEIDEKLAALSNAENALTDLLSIADSAAEDDISRLTSVYEAMKPQDAANLFEQMDPEFSAGFIGRMAPESAALIMTNLEPETSHLISIILASRNTRFPTD